MRRLWRVSGVVAVLAVSALTSAAAPARSAAPGASGFWAVTVPGESFTDSAVQAAGAPGSHVAATIRGMIRAVEAGKTVLVPEGTGQACTWCPRPCQGCRRRMLRSAWPVPGRALAARASYPAYPAL